jgi:hypothetical protein
MKKVKTFFTAVAVMLMLSLFAGGANKANSFSDKREKNNPVRKAINQNGSVMSFFTWVDYNKS